MRELKLSSPPQIHQTDMNVPNDARCLTAFREAANELQIGLQEFSGGPGHALFVIRYENASDLIRLGCMFQTNLNK